MSKLDELKKKLREIFQLDQNDLDFGIYKILNEKNAEVTDFLDNKLIPQVKECFKNLTNSDKTNIQKELDEAISQAQSLGIDPDTSPKVKELKAQLLDSVDLSLLENDVYSHLISFFSRYYNNGDFMSLRRYKKDVYAIPYEGEEVKLHWANSDQYYIKTTENFKDYSFTIGYEDNKKTIHFKLVEAETEKDNNKADKERRFMLIENEPVYIEDKELYIKFEYKVDENKKDQKFYNSSTLEKLLPELKKEDYSNFIGLLELAPTEKNKTRTILEKHLTDYTAKNSFDYFIHKDLGGFLNRELDFYIKNEVLNLDDLDEKNIQKNLGKAKAIKEIAKKLITFLAQLEEFQKKLWLKKKFIVETNYCITLDKIDERFYLEIVNNKEQIEEWEKLFAISEIKTDLTKLGGEVLLSGTDENKKFEFLRQNKNLVIDTKFYSNDFKIKLLAEIESFDKNIDGILINSENANALNLLSCKFKKSIKCIYIDPPFNLGENGDFLYKTNYLDSSWLSLLEERLKIAKELLTDDGVVFVRCDYHGNYIVRNLMNTIFGINNFRNEIFINRIFKNKNNQDIKALPFILDSLLVYSKNYQFSYINPMKKLDEVREAYWRHMNDSAGQGTAKTFYGLTLQPPIDKHWKYSQEKIDEMIKRNELQLFCKKCGYAHNEGNVGDCPKCKSNDWNPKYLVKATDEKILDTNWSDISGYSNTTGFSTENAEVLLERIINISTKPNDFILDFFMGSGTTQAVAHKLNRRWIGVDMGSYFYQYPITRMKQVLHGIEKGISKTSKVKSMGGFKYFTLESYEDACNNLQQKVSQIALSDKLDEQYKLNYMFDFEYSDSLLNIQMFENPFDYKMKITTGNETKERNIDLIETFNYLIGLNVSSIYQKDGFILVEGKNRAEENILVIWRNTKEKSNADLDEFLKKRKISTQDFEFKKIYVNGDNNLQNLQTEDENFKVTLIEEEFKRRMFDIQEV